MLHIPAVNLATRSGVDGAASIEEHLNDACAWWMTLQHMFFFSITSKDERRRLLPMLEMNLRPYIF